MADTTDDGSSYSFTSVSPPPLVITGEHEHEYDYVHYTYGSLSWQSKAPNGEAHALLADGTREIDQSATICLVMI